MNFKVVYPATPTMATQTPETKRGVKVSPIKKSAPMVVTIAVTLLVMLVVKALLLTVHMSWETTSKLALMQKTTSSTQKVQSPI
mmetsp:Transcript_70041/g.150945  ORF Transcript_70041/g.150945 Transcript_70041/m.150945 type:complete len:84 (-) Transcript_70041:567-818(-)